jgi:transcriptional regulator with XRE-family HTH domain
MPFATPELRTRRKAAGIKASPFAERVECSPSHLLNVEARRKPGSDELFARAARELACKVADLVDANPGEVGTPAEQSQLATSRRPKRASDTTVDAA